MHAPNTSKTRYAMLSCFPAFFLLLLWGCFPEPTQYTQGKAEKVAKAQKRSTSKNQGTPQRTPKASKILELMALQHLPSSPRAFKDVQPKSRLAPMKLHSMDAPTFSTPGWDLSQKSQERFIAHEWGTFTSVQSSIGKTMDGLHHTEEALPNFVHRRRWGSPFRKSLEIVPIGVNQKLETPVIYFYTNKATKVSVEVDFPKGILSEYYPNVTSFRPAIPYGGRQGAVPKGGFLRWDGDVKPGSATFPYVKPDDIWMPSRQVPAAIPFYAKLPRGRVEVEKFIFYRGVGRFVLPIQLTTNAKNEVTVFNNSKEKLPAFLLVVQNGKGKIVSLGTIQAGQKIIQKIPTPVQTIDQYIDAATKSLAASLIKTGLYKDEAWAMVNTWRKSYFHTPGVRVLYVVPKNWTDALLPIRISPKPTELVRTLVGRVDVLTVSEEQRVLALVKTAYTNGHRYVDLKKLGRFAEPKLRRALELLKDPKTIAYCAKQVEYARYYLQ